MPPSDPLVRHPPWPLLIVLLATPIIRHRHGDPAPTDTAPTLELAPTPLPRVGPLGGTESVPFKASSLHDALERDVQPGQPTVGGDGRHRLVDLLGFVPSTPCTTGLTRGSHRG